ncbi:MAG: hypothetical protein OJF50_004600 [Nitrospira sp.]|nr:hypothetical protein [Nitrospira sp.]
MTQRVRQPNCRRNRHMPTPIATKTTIVLRDIVDDPTIQH